MDELIEMKELDAEGGPPHGRTRGRLTEADQEPGLQSPSYLLCARAVHMDPFYVSTPAQTGQVALSGTPGLSIYYELRGIEHGEKVVLIMGAFATLRTFDELADCLAKGYQVLTYDHRGIGKSANASGRPLETQTAEMLAQDALALVNAVWGEAERFHIYGASMGGMVAQALSLVALPRVKSLQLAVTSRGSKFRLPWLTRKGLFKLLLPMLVKKDRGAMVDFLISKTMTPSHAAKVHTPDGKTVGQLWKERWTREYEEWFAFGDRDVVSAQACVVALWWLTDAQAHRLRDSGVPTTVYVSNGDDLMPAAQQHQLAQALAAKELVFEGGHLGELADGDKYPKIFAAVLEHMDRVTSPPAAGAGAQVSTSDLKLTVP